MSKQPKRRRLTKAERLEVYSKCGGHCAYCGKRIGIAYMQVDHVEPVSGGGKDDLGNMLPACNRCNCYKGHMRLEAFRSTIERSPITLNRYLEYRRAVRFGVVLPNLKSVVFYFEGTVNHGDQDALETV